MNKSTIKKLYQEYEVPAHIIAHMEKVAQVAKFLAEKITANSQETIDLETLINAVLLHDIAKMQEIKNKDSLEDHTIAGYKILLAQQEETIANIIKKHRYNSIIDKDPIERPITLEEKIMHYADKRVQNDKIVSIKVRVETWWKKCFPKGNIPDDGIKAYEALRHLEQELCQLAGIKPEEINKSSIKTSLP